MESKDEISAIIETVVLNNPKDENIAEWLKTPFDSATELKEELLNAEIGIDVKEILI